jgi:hypothetical protein
MQDILLVKEIREVFRMEGDKLLMYNSEVRVLLGEEGLPVVYWEGRLRQLHRIVWLLHNEPDGFLDVTFIDGNPRNISLANLKEIDLDERITLYEAEYNSSSRYKGIYWCKRRGKWIAQIKKHGNKTAYVGQYDTEQEAHRGWLKSTLLYQLEAV